MHKFTTAAFCPQVEKEEQAKREAEMALGGKAVADTEQWGDVQPTEWTTTAEGPGIGITPQQPVPAFGTTTATTTTGEDWSVGPTTTTTTDWAADDAGDWGNAEPKVYAIVAG